MEESTRTTYDSIRTFENKAFHSACYAPFVSLFFNSLGNVLACCKNDTYLLGNVTGQRLKEIWNGGKIKKLREALAQYRFEAGCEFCEWQIGEGNYQGSFPWLFERFPVDSMEPEWPAMIEFAGSNTCNFECIMCNGELSSSIRAHRDGLPPLPRLYDDRFFEDLRPFLAHLRQAKFLGGEPFLAAECHRIWSMMIEEGLMIPCHVTTNGSQYNQQVEHVLENLPVSITVSIDGATKETYQKIRLNSNYDEVMANVRRLREYTRYKREYFGIAFCLMRQNWHEFVDMLLLAEELKCSVFVNTVIGPSRCSLFTLPVKEISQIADEIEKQGSLVENRLRINHGVWKENIRRLRGKSREGQAASVGKILDTYWDLQDQFSVAMKLAREGHFEESLEALGKVDKKHVSYYRSVALSGNIRRLLGDLAGSEQDLGRALKITSKRPEAFLYLAMLRLDQNRLTEALENALTARTLIKEEELLESEICGTLAATYIRLEKVPEALTVLDRLLILNPEKPEAHVLRCHAHRMAGRPDQAMLEVETALSIDANHWEAVNLREELISESTSTPQF